MTTQSKEWNAENVQSFALRGAVISLALSMLLSSLGVSAANVALPTLAEAFNAPFQAVQWIVIAYLLATTIMIVSVGRLGDIIGHRRVLLSGIALFTTASLLCGVAPSFWLLIVFRALQGLGGAILLALTIALVRDTVPAERTGSAMGLLATMSSIGTALGPTFGGFLLAGPGWRAIFLIMVPLGLLTFWLAYRYLPTFEKSSATKDRSFDVLGTALLGLSLSAYALAVTVGGGDFKLLNLGLLIGALVGGILFVFTQTKVANPLIQLSIFRNRIMSASLIMNICVMTVMMSTLIVGPFYLAEALDLPDAWVGLAMSVGPLVSTFTGVPAGRLVDRLGGSMVIIVGLVEMLLGVVSVVVLPDLIGLIGYIVALGILTPGYQLFQAANNTTVMLDIDADQRGLIAGMLSLSRSLGLITGASVMGAIFALATRTNEISTASAAQVTTGMQITFSVAGVLIMIALGLAIRNRVEVNQRKSQRDQHSE